MFNYSMMRDDDELVKARILNEETAQEETMKYPMEEDFLGISVQENLTHKLQSILQECDELVRIFNRSIETARINGRNERKN